MSRKRRITKEEMRGKKVKRKCKSKLEYNVRHEGNVIMNLETRTRLIVKQLRKRCRAEGLRGEKSLT